MIMKNSLSIKRQNGVYLVWVVVVVPVLFAFLSFAVTVGVFLNERGKAQTSADAAAMGGIYLVRRVFGVDDELSGTTQLQRNAAVIAAAEEAAQLQGADNLVVKYAYYDNDLGQWYIYEDGTTTVLGAGWNQPYPTTAEISGGETGTAAYVYTQVSANQGSFFSGDLLPYFVGTVQAEALARYKEKRPRTCPGIHLTESNDPKKFDINNSTLEVIDGGIFVDTSHENALHATPVAEVKADWVQTTGGLSNPNVTYTCELEPSPCPELYRTCTNCTTPPDFALAADCDPTTDSAEAPEYFFAYVDLTLSLPKTLSAGTYCGGLIIDGVGGTRFLPSIYLQEEFSPPGSFFYFKPMTSSQAADAKDEYPTGQFGNVTSPSIFNQFTGGLSITESAVAVRAGHEVVIYATEPESPLSNFSVDLTASSLTGEDTGKFRIYGFNLRLQDGSLLEVQSFDSASCGAPLEIYTGLVK